MIRYILKYFLPKIQNPSMHSRFSCVTIGLMLLLGLTACAADSDSVPIRTVEIVVKSEANWFFDKYDFIIDIDGTESFSVSHGKEEDYSTKLTQGTHSITIRTPDLRLNNEIDLPITVEKANQKFSYTVKCEGSKFIVADSFGASYDSSVKADVVSNPISLISADADILNLDRTAIYAHPFVLQDKYIRTVVIPTKIDDTYFEAKPSGEKCKFLVFWHDDFKNATKDISVGQPIVIIGKESGYATFYNTVHIEDAVIDDVDPIEVESELKSTIDIDNQLLDKMVLTSFEQSFRDKVIAEELQFVCAQTNIDINGISDIEASDNWAGGKCFRFLYTDFETSDTVVLRIACNADSSIQSLWCGKTEVYARGYEPYSIKDYISLSEADNADSLYILSQSQIESLLKYPSSAKFDSNYDYTYSQGICTISGTVSAKNAAGMRSDMAYTVKYQINNTSASLKYLKLDGTIYINLLGDITSEDRKKSDIQTPADIMAKNDTREEEIHLVYNELGIYGQVVSYDGLESIEYHVTPGTYKITNNANACKVYLATDKYHKNSDGYMENDLIDTIEFSAKGQTNLISIDEGEHLELTIGADISLSPQS